MIWKPRDNIKSSSNADSFIIIKRTKLKPNMNVIR